MVEIDYRVARLRRILVIIILATLPCYLLGVIVLWIGNAARNNQTPTPAISTIIITATPMPTFTKPVPSLYPTPTGSATPTVTPTFTLTPTHTQTSLPTNTATQAPTATSTDTPVPETVTPTETTAP